MSTQSGQNTRTVYSSRRKWGVLAATLPARFVINGLAWASFTLLLSSICTEMGWSDAQRTAASSAYQVGQVIAMLLIGFLLDKFSVKKLFAFAIILLAGVAVLMRGCATNFPIFYISVVLYGFPYGAILLSTVKLWAMWFPKDQMAVANGCNTAFGTLGQFCINFASTPILMMTGGWRGLWIICSIILFASFFLFWFLCPERGQMDAEVKPQYDKSELGLWKSFRTLIKVPRVWCLWVSDIAQGATIMTCSTYASIVLQNDPNWGLDRAAAGHITMFTNIGSLIGYFVLQQIIRKVVRRKGYDAMPVMSFGIGLISCILFAIGYNSFNIPTAQACCLIGGIGMSAMIIAPRTLQIQQPEVAGPRAGTVNGIGGIIARVVGIGLSTLAGIIAAYFNNTSVIMYILYGFMALNPIFLLVYLGVRKHEIKIGRLAAENPADELRRE